MRSATRDSRPVRTVALALAIVLWLPAAVPLMAADPDAPPPRAAAADAESQPLSVQLPPGPGAFPEGEGSTIANSQCVMCHSADMVLLQPPRTQAEWRATINKMRTAFGAPLPADEIEPLAAYLAALSALDGGS